MNDTGVREPLIRRMMKTAYQKNIPLMVASSPGTGKTDHGIQFGHDMSARTIIFHPVVDDPTDYKGMPVRTRDGGAEFVPYNRLKLLMEINEDCLAIFDDTGQATMATQSALMQFALARELNGKKISDKVRFMFFTNRRGDKANVSGILEPLKSRCVLFNYEPTVKEWTPWALKNGVSLDIIGYLNFDQTEFNNFQPNFDIVNSPNPRNWVRFSDALKDYPKIENIPDSEFPFIHAWADGCVGISARVKFLAFTSFYKELPDLDKLIANPKIWKAPKNREIYFAVSSGLLGRADKKNLKNIIDVIVQFPPEICLYAGQIIDEAYGGLLKNSGAPMDNWVKVVQDLV